MTASWGPVVSSVRICMYTEGLGWGQSTHQLPEVAVGLDQIYLSIRDPSLYRTASWVPMSSIARFHCTCVCEHTLEPSNAASSYHRTSCHRHINAHHPSAVPDNHWSLTYVQGYTYLHTYMYTYLCRHVWLCTVLAQRGPSGHDTVSGTTTHRNVNKYSEILGGGS